MAQEIERKFLLKNNKWKTFATDRFVIKQGYLNTDKERTVRVRVKGTKGFLTIKSKNIGMVRNEFEYEIPVRDAEQLILLCEQPIIDKTRYIIPKKDHIWEIDIFRGDNEGLAIAEVELTHPEQKIPIPRWIGQEVTGDPKYYNSSLVKTPYKDWE